MKKLTQKQVKTMMETVLLVRYTDLEHEKSLCEDLMRWGEVNKDFYVIAFAHTYLGDYYIAQNDTVACMPYLTEARERAISGGYDELLVRVYSLLAIYYESIADEPSALQYYVEGIAASRKVGDRVSEGLILNNIAFTFQRHEAWDLALQYYKDGYELLQKAGPNHAFMQGIIRSNHAALLILSGHPEEAEPYIRECEAGSEGQDLLKLLSSQNWCQYYTAIGDAAEALSWADRVLSMEETTNENKLYLFDIYSTLFDCMVLLGEAGYAMRILGLLDQCYVDNRLDQRRQLELQHITYCRTFETDHAIIAAAYQRYCHRMIDLDGMGNQVITNGLRDAIRLSKVDQQKKELNAKTSSLEQEVNLDELTKVHNRRYLEQFIEQWEIAPGGKSLGFIMIDVDCLKEYNDTYGHMEGDQVLRTVGACLRAHAPETIYPCRFGGDEFVCACVDLTDGEIVDYLNAVRGELRIKNIPHKASRCAQQVTLSIGFSNESAAVGLMPRAVLELADKALYCSKMNGRNTYHKQAFVPASPVM